MTIRAKLQARDPRERHRHEYSVLVEVCQQSIPTGFLKMSAISSFPLLAFVGIANST